MPTITFTRTKTVLENGAEIEKEYDVKYEVKDVLLMEDLETINIYNLYRLNEEMKDKEKKMKIMLDLKSLRSKFDPLINACLVEKTDLGKFTMGEYMGIAINPAVMGAFTKSMKGMPELDITNPTSKKE